MSYPSVSFLFVSNVASKPNLKSIKQKHNQESSFKHDSLHPSCYIFQTANFGQLQPLSCSLLPCVTASVKTQSDGVQYRLLVWSASSVSLAALRTGFKGAPQESIIMHLMVDPQSAHSPNFSISIMKSFKIIKATRFVSSL